MSILYIISISLIVLGYILLMVGASINISNLYKTKEDRTLISKLYRYSLISSFIGILLLIGLIIIIN